MQPIVTSAGILKLLAHQVVQTEDVVELAKSQQSTIGADLGAVECHPDPAIKIQPSALRLAFTRNVRNPRL